MLCSGTGWAVPVQDAWDEVSAWRYSEDFEGLGERGEDKEYFEYRKTDVEIMKSALITSLYKLRCII